MHLPYSLDSGRLSALFTDEGFQDVRIRIQIETARFPSPEEFLLRQAASSPLANLLEQASEEVHAALIDDVTTALKDRQDDDGLVLPMETYVVLGHVQENSA